MTDPQRNTGTIADSFEPLPTFAAPKPTGAPLRPAPSLSELYQAGHDVARVDRSDFESDMLRDGYRPILEALGDDTKYRRSSYMGKDYDAHILNPGDLISGGQNTQYGAITSREDMEEAIAGKIRAHRAKDPNFLKGIPDTVPELRKYFAANEKARRDKGQAVLDRGSGFTAGVVGFAGQGAEAFHDPLNIATLPIGGGGKTVLQTVGREILVNAGLEAIQQPIVADNREIIGEDLSFGEAATNVATAGIFGGLLEGGLHIGAKGIEKGYDLALPHIFNAMPEGVQRAWADKMELGIAVPGGELRVPLTDALAQVPTLDVVDGARRLINPVRMTPEERAVLNVLERDAEISASSPFTPGMAGDHAHTTNLAEAINALIANKPAPEPAIAVGPITGSGAGNPAPAPGRPPAASSTAAERPPVGNMVQGEAAIAAFKNKTRRAESGGVDHAKNPRSSAEGRFQFTDDTFVDYYHKVIDAGASRGAILAQKFNVQLQERLMDSLTRDNAAALTRAGLPVTEGNLYLAHFLGSGGAVKVLKADPSRPVSGLLPKSFLTANPEVLGRGQSASEVAAWAARKMGGKAGSVPAVGALGDFAEIAGDQTIAQLKAQANAYTQQAIGETLLPGGGRVPLYGGTFRPGDILVDAARFQFKGGGDDRGVIDTLRGVERWDAGFAGRVMLWQDVEGKTWLADGHQRLGLATRLEAEHGGAIPLEAMVLRESDGVSAVDARVYAALKNIAEGSGTRIDAAKVVRDAGDHVLAHLPPKSALVRDGRALASLSDDAFGAVYNELISPDIAAVIGHLLPDRPDAHEAMIALLMKLDPANRGQAESIVRQAIAAGMHKEEQIDLFGSGEVTSTRFLEKAKVLEKGLARIKQLKGAFKAATVHASTLEAKGSKIARDRTAEEAKAYAEAAEIISRVAFSRDNPVSDALNDAAGELLGGAKLGDVVTRFVDRVADVDLGALSRAVAGDDASRLAPDGAGRGGDALGEGEAVSAEPSDPGQPSLLELEDAAERFSDPDGPAIEQQADSLEHDFRTPIEWRRAAMQDQLRSAVVAMRALADGAPEGTFGNFRWKRSTGFDGGDWIDVFEGDDPGANMFLQHDLFVRLQRELADFTPEDLGVTAEELADVFEAVKDRKAALETLEAEVEANRKAKVRPTDEHILAGIELGAEGWLGNYVKLLRELSEKTGIPITPANVGRFADEIAAEDFRPGNHGFMGSWIDKWINSHVPDNSFIVRDAKHRLVGRAPTMPDAEAIRQRHAGGTIDYRPAVDLPMALEDMIAQSTARGVNADGEPLYHHPEHGFFMVRNHGGGPASDYADFGGVQAPVDPAPSSKADLLAGTAAIDPGIAARQREEVALRAKSPLRPGDVDADGTMGLGLFDAADEPGLDFGNMTFRLDEEGGEISAADLLAELDEDKKAIDTLRGCL